MTGQRIFFKNPKSSLQGFELKIIWIPETGKTGRPRTSCETSGTRMVVTGWFRWNPSSPLRQYAWAFTQDELTSESGEQLELRPTRVSCGDFSVRSINATSRWRFSPVDHRALSCVEFWGRNLVQNCVFRRVFSGFAELDLELDLLCRFWKNFFCIRFVKVFMIPIRKVMRHREWCEVVMSKLLR